MKTPGLALSLLLPIAACTTLGDDLRRTQSLYKDAQYEAAMAWLVDLEQSTAGMTRGQRAGFYYLRGMTAYRLGQRDDALHFLALATAMVDEEERLLNPAWRAVMERTLQELVPTDASSHARNPLRPDTI